MTDESIASASGVIDAPATEVFEKIADPAIQPTWDGNDNLESAEPGQRVKGVGDVFVMTNVGGSQRENHVVEFDEGKVIAWKPAMVGQDPAGHVWKWELEALEDGTTKVTHTYDWTDLDRSVEGRVNRAKSTDETYLKKSIDRLGASFA